MPKQLTQDQLEHYHERGFICPVDVFSSDDTAMYRSKLEAYEAETGSPIGAVERVGGHLLFTWIDELIRNERLLDAVEDLIGPNILCWNTVFWIKEVGSPSYVGWHQDLEYWGLDNNDLVNVWVALSPATADSGCMNVIPGSHKELLDHDETYADDNMLTRGQELKIDVGDREVVTMALQPGQVSMHNVRLAHGSGPNTSDDRRIGLSMQYIPTHTRQKLVEWDKATLVRGVDEHGNFVLTPRPTKDFDPVCVDFHKRAGDELRKLLYQGANKPEEKAATL